MQSILTKLSNTKLSKEEILEVVTMTKRHDVLLQVMKKYPENEELACIIAENDCTVYDLEYVKKNVPNNTKLVKVMEATILRKVTRLYISDVCSSIRYIYGPDHVNTQNVEFESKSLDECIEMYDVDCDNDEIVWDKYNYMCGTIEGSQEAVGALLKTWFSGTTARCGNRGRCYNCRGCHLLKGIENGNMLTLAIERGAREEIIRQIKERIDGGD